MKKEKADLEQLLNSLIEKGWRPRNIECKSVKSTDHCLEFYTELQTVGWIMKNERDLVSKESGLWQFCEENKMLIGFSPRRWTKNAEDCYGLVRGDIEYWGHNYEYRLIESVLKDESELEDFLLQNIIIKNE